MIITNIWKVIKATFQSTNQIYVYIQYTLGHPLPALPARSPRWFLGLPHIGRHCGEGIWCNLRTSAAHGAQQSGLASIGHAHLRNSRSGTIWDLGSSGIYKISLGLWLGLLGFWMIGDDYWSNIIYIYLRRLDDLDDYWDYYSWGYYYWDDYCIIKWDYDWDYHIIGPMGLRMN